MCGLVGLFGNPILTQRPLEVMRWLLWLDTLRGEDSTGVAIRKHVFGQSPRLCIAKSPGAPTNIYKRYPEIFSTNGEFLVKKNEDISMVIGHNRAATIGGLNLNNAHPFHHGNIVGAHNGTIQYGLNALPKGKELKGQTDSEQIFYALSQGWLLQDVVDKLTGALALTWWDSKEQTLNLYRNNERPLWTIENNGGSVVMWASEKWMLETSISRTKNKGFFKEPVELPVNTLWSYKLNNNVLVKSIKNINKLVNNYPANHSNYNDNSGSGLIRTADSEKYPAFLAKERESSTINRFKSGWLDMSHLTEEEFNNKTKYGCSLCQGDLDWKEKEEVYWLEKDTCLCHNCAAANIMNEDV